MWKSIKTTYSNKVNKLQTVSIASVLYWILNSRPIECLYIHQLHTVKNSQWKACTVKYTQKSCATAKSRSVREIDSASASSWFGWRSFSTSQTMSSLREKEKTESTLTTFSTPYSSSSSTYSSLFTTSNIEYILLLLSLLYCFHPLLVSTFSATFWVNCVQLVWSHH